MDSANDPTLQHDVEREVYHASRPGFRIAELKISPTQKVPWHCHSNVQDTFYVLEGLLRLFLRDPKEEVLLAPRETYSVRPKRAHLVTNASETAATFLVLQGIGEYDFILLT
jgi:quercetin dioxygenase-like cupin family protein